jgi:hypothetical protein
MKIYAEDRLDNLLSSKMQEIKNRIESERDDYILNVGEEQYIEHLISEFTLDIPEIHTDQVYVDTYEKEIQGSRFPMEFMISDPNRSFKRDIIVYHIPYTGSIDLLKFRPSSWTSMAGYEIQIERQSRTIVLEYINFYNDASKIKRAYDDSVGYIFGSYGHLKNDIEKYNNGLEGFIRSIINARRQQINKKSDFLSSLGVPVKKKQSTPQTFAVPKPKLRDRIFVKPVVHAKGFKPEPTLDIDNYNKILKIINDIGKNFERLPSTYSNKEEEDLRDHILMILDPNFEYGSASGETFNKSGKTDIQLRHDSSVLFISECKFWGGEKAYFKTIDQLLSYLTWRDSKTSIVIFVRNKDFSSVFATVKTVTSNHPNFVRELDQSDESWFNYIFSLPNDSNKELKLAVQLFHIP